MNRYSILGKALTAHHCLTHAGTGLYTLRYIQPNVIGCPRSGLRAVEKQLFVASLSRTEDRTSFIFPHLNRYKTVDTKQIQRPFPLFAYRVLLVAKEAVRYYRQ